MALPKSDWIKDAIWTEYHLTATGWVRGTHRTERGRYENELEPPPDRLMTVRSLQIVPSDPAKKPIDETEIRWVTGATARQYLEEAQNNWGVLPLHAPALSGVSADANSGLSNVRLMCKSEMQRPLGRRVKAPAQRWT